MTINTAWLRERAAEFRASVAFLTRMPFATAPNVTGATVGHGAWAFPIVGLIVGLVAAVVFLLARRVGLTFWPAAVLCIAVSMAITGCLHEDGLADTIDGFGGGKTREQKLAIMRDSRIGVYGVCALAIAVLLRASALAGLPTATQVVLALIAAHGAARATLPVFMFFVSPARTDGLSASAGQPPFESVIAAAVLGMLILGLCLGSGLGIVALILLLVAMAVMAWLCLNQIDGQTGDVLGAVEQVSEIIVLLVALR